MKLVRLVYYSQASRSMNLSDLRNILETARSNNSELKVCGMLCFENEFFLQALEGDRETVNELYLDIADDPRHEGATILSYDEVEQPTFELWKMGYAAGSESFYELLRKNGQTEFDPEEMTRAQALSFLKDMAGNQTDV
ncbi:BLUF domain-containing protein [Pseudoalteromonas sp. SMS1]|uniref:BLUF domain-containing protein n=1 Tax=Pseudoalteromonas sp. SMS1 TaxID=2908894 RepID=UPI001F2FFDD7|nr:BLUF domain-containing protein [Pseudoalteromonas sp. SMS1]MCF2857669.1 BLUF domain-containing protein [Pseudoalteromonas sp. SMS1]